MTKHTYDVVVIGGGLLGSLTALQLAKMGKSVAVIDNGLKGASTNNAGFLTAGSFEEFLATEKALGIDRAREILKNRQNGVVSFYGEFVRHTSRHSTGLELTHVDYSDEIKHHGLQRCYGMVKTPGFNERYHCVRNYSEYMIQPLDVLKDIHKQCVAAGVTYVSSEVKAIHDWSVEIKDGQRVEYSSLVVCANAFTQTLLPEYTNITPGRGQVYVTKPLEKKNPVYCPTHYNKGYVYFRPVSGNRVLIGGGRDTSMDTENTLEFENTDNIKDYLSSLLSDITQEPIEIDYGWSGIMAFTPNSLPVVEKVVDRTNVYVGMCCNGMGIALSIPTSQSLANLVITHG